MGGWHTYHQIYKTVLFDLPNIFQDFAFKNLNTFVGRIRFSFNLLTVGDKSSCMSTKFLVNSFVLVFQFQYYSIVLVLVYGC